jgi:hypothetical protein
VSHYLVERYLPDRSVDDIAAAIDRLRVVTIEMAAEGISIRHLSSAFVPDDEACLCQFEAPSSEALAVANERSAFPFARIVPIVRITDVGGAE